VCLWGIKCFVVREANSNWWIVAESFVVVRDQTLWTWSSLHLLDRSFLKMKRNRYTFIKLPNSNSSCSIENNLIHLVKQTRSHILQKVSCISHRNLLKISLWFLKLPLYLLWLPTLGNVLQIKRTRFIFVKFRNHNISCSIENNLIHFFKPSRFHVWQNRRRCALSHTRCDTHLTLVSGKLFLFLLWGTKYYLRELSSNGE
jgi:hypothetical protein